MRSKQGDTVASNWGRGHRMRALYRRLGWTDLDQDPAQSDSGVRAGAPGGQVPSPTASLSVLVLSKIGVMLLPARLYFVGRPPMEKIFLKWSSPLPFCLPQEDPRYSELQGK